MVGFEEVFLKNQSFILITKPSKNSKLLRVYSGISCARHFSLRFSSFLLIIIRKKINIQFKFTCKREILNFFFSSLRGKSIYDLLRKKVAENLIFHNFSQFLLENAPPRTK